MTAAGTAHARRSAIDRADNLCVPERGRYIRARNARHTTQARPDELIRELDLLSYFAPHYTRRFVSSRRFRGFEDGHCRTAIVERSQFTSGNGATATDRHDRLEK